VKRPMGIASLAVALASLGLAEATAAAQQAPCRLDPTDIKIPDGYAIEAVITNLSVPTTAVFDGDDLLIAESGWVNTARPRVLRVRPDGQVSVVASDGLEGPVTGLLLQNGQLFVSHKSKVSVVEAGLRLRDIVTDLPSKGDHQNNNLVLGPDGKVYLGQGTTTNAAVVGVDNYIFGWLPEQPQAHEVPCQDITLVGQNFESENPLRKDGSKVTTGAYQPFGTLSSPGELVKGEAKCGGSILRFNPDGSNLELVAWGLRNPFGLKFDRVGQLWATFHGADVRGSRNIFNDPDYLVRVEQGAWYGWPEFFDGRPVTDGSFDAPGKPKPEFLWQEHPPLARAFTTFPPHEGVNGLALSPGGAFGFEGEAFVAMFGTFAPVTTGTNIQPVGFRVVRVDLTSGEVHNFAANAVPGPAYINQQGGFDRPSDLVFGPDQSLYVVDWGASTLTPEGLKLQPQTGIIWRIYPSTSRPLRPNGPVLVEPALTAEAERKPEVRNVRELYKMVAPELAMIIGGLLLGLLIVAAVVVVRRRSRHQPPGARWDEPADAGADLSRQAEDH
jgi:glucose/arabinose dehydrogenase